MEEGRLSAEGFVGSTVLSWVVYAAWCSFGWFGWTASCQWDAMPMFQRFCTVCGVLSTTFAMAWLVTSLWRRRSGS